MDQVLGQILRQAVWERLDMLDELASGADNGALLSVARNELPRLAHGWRALLASHVPDPRGRCPECSSYWRSRATLCSVWRAAHAHLIPADAVPSTASTTTGSGVTVSSEATVSARETVTSETGTSLGSDFSWSVFSRFKIRRSILQARRPASLFPAVVPAGAGAAR